MAAENPPTPSSTSEYTPPPDYEFDPAEELEPSNDLLDVVLTRTGEFVLDVIEAVQAHPVLAGSLAAAAVGLAGGLVAARVVPRRRPATPLARGKQAAEVVRRRVRWGRGALGERAQEIAAGAATLPARGRRGWQAAVPLLRRGGRTAEALASSAPLPRPAADGRGALGRVQAFAQLGPLAITLLRNPIVRDLALHLISRQVRRATRR
ncbi:MAG TPA: hypothetical protein VKZ60_13880 [Chloroflexota bacterium]|jgi:hypothetical protein|nr:hypothetical protein [Chloroflexota bacterium]